MLMLALDWRKVLDSISPERLFCCLKRFGIPNEIVEVVPGIYEQRKFFVKHGHHKSAWYEQSFGIVQGCPLSPFLFSIAMSCLLFDADNEIKARYEDITIARACTRTILYADDTLIIEDNAEVVQAMMDVIRQLGAQYGLEFNESKLEVLSINHLGELTAPIIGGFD